MTARRYIAGYAAIIIAVGLHTPAFGHGKQHNPTRFQYVQSKGIPPEYAGLLNPLAATPESLAAGKELYSQNCVACHGGTGEGDGEMAKDLEPKPSNIAVMYEMPMMGMGNQGRGAHMMHGTLHHHPGTTHAQAMGGTNLDAYMFWAVSEGGEPMGSAMPAFKDTLSEDERWEILLYVANGFKTELQ